MNIERMLRAIAGFFILVSAALAHYHSMHWLWFTGFVGINLLQSAFTNWCPMITFLEKMGVKHCGSMGTAHPTEMNSHVAGHK